MKSLSRFRSVLGLMIIFAAMIVASISEVPARGEEIRNPVDLTKAITQVAKQNIPAIVHIEVIQGEEIANPILPFESEPSFRYFFNQPKISRKFRRELKGTGTGMIMNDRGHILTNHHVVFGATDILVLLSNGIQYKAKLVGTDPKTDLAVIQISTKEKLAPVTFGDSDKVEVGEWVIAIGHPRGLDQTVTQGIISAKHRQGITHPSRYQDYLQTDAAINPGNSGGPLLNLNGEVIGINMLIVSESGGFEGISFAIPSNMAFHIANNLIEHGKVQRGWIGISMQDLTPELANSFSLPSTKGALIVDLMEGGPAEKGGIKRGDIVISFAGKEIHDAGVLRNEIANTPIGKDIKTIVWRNGKKKEINIKIGNIEDVTKMLNTSAKERLGVVVRSLTSKETEIYGLELSEGVVIRWLDSKGALGEAGFEVGDILLELNSQSIESVEGFAELASVLQPNQQITVLAMDHKSGQAGYAQVIVK